MLGAAAFTPQAAVGHQRAGAAATSAAAPSPSSSSAGRWPRCWACRCRPTSARPGAGAGPSSAWPCSACWLPPGVWRALPDGIRPPALSLADWRTVFTHPVLMAIVAVTALSSAGPVHAVQLLRALLPARCCGASAAQISLLFLWFGAVRPARQRAADALHRPHRRRHRSGADAGLHGAVAAGLAAGHRLRRRCCWSPRPGRWAASRPTRRSRPGWRWRHRRWPRR